MKSVDFDLQPTLQGRLIDVRPLRAGDFESLFAAASDPLIWEQHPERDRYKRDVFQNALQTVERAIGESLGKNPAAVWRWAGKVD